MVRSYDALTRENLIKSVEKLFGEAWENDDIQWAMSEMDQYDLGDLLLGNASAEQRFNKYRSQWNDVIAPAIQSGAAEAEDMNLDPDLLDPSLHPEPEKWHLPCEECGLVANEWQRFGDKLLCAEHFLVHSSLASTNDLPPVEQ